MSILVNAHQISKSFTTRPLFEQITFSVESGDRVGLIGPNGAGKSTLLKILAGLTTVDNGILSVQRGLRIGYLEQSPTLSSESTIQDTILDGVGDLHDWERMAQAHEIMSKLSLDPDLLIKNLSGGWKKRVALARELLKNPDLLLLDEPTNHLDVESILWLEDLLADSSFATLTITHDRLFLQRISNRIIELDRRHKGGLLSVKGDYATYLELREDLLAAQELHETKLKNTLRRETEWLRRGAKARQTKQQARIQNAGTLKAEVEELEHRNKTMVARLDFQSLEKNPKKLIEAKTISKSYDGKVIVPSLSLIISPKTRLGLMGVNGCGKSTLIKLLTGKETPDAGSVFHADRLQVAYFEQNRESLDPNLSVIDTICPKGDFVEFRGTKVHIKSYLSRFLFSYEQMGLAVGKLSGGEQSRLLIARLMLNEANVLILDEPTNDLDMATLDVLEEVLRDFNGAVILVTHDRYFLDRVVNSILTFGYGKNGEKQITPLSGLEQWEEWHSLQDKVKAFTGQTEIQNEKVQPKKKKLSYKDQRELDNIEETIKKAEEHLAGLTEESMKSANAANASLLSKLGIDMEKAQSEVDRLYARWSELTKS
jgi:ATP-binding cassette subfamily F protein uup